MASAEIITIGTEILLGEIVDTNAQYIARAIRDFGIDLYWKTTVGDNVQRIAKAIQQAMQRAEIIITTGGLGPTVDDPTREGVALSVGVETEYHPELWEQIEARFKRYGRQPTDNNRRQAYIPKGAIAVENPVGTAPAFIVYYQDHIIFSLPGVPKEMEYLLQHAVIPYLQHEFNLQSVIKARVIHTAGVGESQIDDLVGDLEKLNNPTLGLAAHSGQVDLRITAKASTEAEANALIAPIETVLRERLGNWIYGTDQDTLESTAMQSLEDKGWHLVVVEAGLHGELINRLATHPGPFLGGEVRMDTPTEGDLLTTTSTCREKFGAEVGLGVAIYPGTDRQDIHLALITPDGQQVYHRPYGGAPGNAPRWALHNSLDLIRNL